MTYSDFSCPITARLVLNIKCFGYLLLIFITKIIQPDINQASHYRLITSFEKFSLIISEPAVFEKYILILQTKPQFSTSQHFCRIPKLYVSSCPTTDSALYYCCDCLNNSRGKNILNYVNIIFCKDVNMTNISFRKVSLLKSLQRF